MAKEGMLGKRKPKSSKDLARVAPTRHGRDRVLIVCEGGKTEPNYLREMRSDMGLTNADVEVCGEECGTDPKSVLQYALDLFEEDKSFDKIYCVFDKEGTPERHKNYAEACYRIQRKRMPPGKSLVAIGSVPCFEYWVLLHYKSSTAAYEPKGKKSSGDCAVSDVKKCIPNYAKGMKSLYSVLKEKTEFAIKNAKAALNQISATGTDNPSTSLHILVQHLQDLAKQ